MRMSKTKYADSTLNSWTKDELIHQIRILEHNYAVQREFNDNQAKLLEKWAPVVHAYWKRVDKDDGGHDTVCSHCSTPIVTYLETPYCHNCGAKMDGGARNDG